MKFPKKCSGELKKQYLLYSENIILLNNKFDGEKVGTINIKKYKKKVSANKYKNVKIKLMKNMWVP